MDWAILDAYGWRDMPTDYEFLLDCEIVVEEWGSIVDETLESSQRNDRIG